jgi:hypothetical protein
MTTTGSGSGPSQLGTTQPVMIAAGTPSAQLYPGGSSDVSVSISNPNPIRVHIGSLSLDPTQGSSGFAVDTSHSGCGLSTLSFTTQTNGGGGWFVPAKVGSTNGVLNIDLTSAIAMGTGAANACQGASFSVYLQAGV